MTTHSIKEIQIALKGQGFDPGEIDGVMGPKTEQAIIAFKIKHGWAGRPFLGPLTIAALFGGEPEDMPDQTAQLPWVNELAKHLGWHEVINNAELEKWLRSDGATVGDPAKIPWCSDCMETAVRLSLPNEWAVTDPRLRANPYWAQNWQFFGLRCDPPRYGSLGVFKRDGGGHIAALIGIDRKLNRLRIRGGNQSNRVSDTWIDARRMIACRKPQTWHSELPKLPEMNSSGQIISANEA